MGVNKCEQCRFSKRLFTKKVPSPFGGEKKVLYVDCVHYGEKEALPSKNTAPQRKACEKYDSKGTIWVLNMENWSWKKKKEV